MTAKLRGLSTS